MVETLKETKNQLNVYLEEVKNKLKMMINLCVFLRWFWSFLFQCAQSSTLETALNIKQNCRIRWGSALAIVIVLEQSVRPFNCYLHDRNGKWPTIVNRMT